MTKAEKVAEILNAKSTEIIVENNDYGRYTDREFTDDEKFKVRHLFKFYEEPKISPLQAKTMLNRLGKLDEIESCIESADRETQLAWENATAWNRFSPLLEGVAVHFEIDLDSFFEAAKKIDL